MKASNSVQPFVLLVVGFYSVVEAFRPSVTRLVGTRINSGGRGGSSAAVTETKLYARRPIRKKTSAKGRAKAKKTGKPKASARARASAPKGSASPKRSAPPNRARARKTAPTPSWEDAPAPASEDAPAPASEDASAPASRAAPAPTPKAARVPARKPAPVPAPAPASRAAPAPASRAAPAPAPKAARVPAPKPAPVPAPASEATAAPASKTARATVSKEAPVPPPKPAPASASKTLPAPAPASKTIPAPAPKAAAVPAPKPAPAPDDTATVTTKTASRPDEPTMLEKTAAATTMSTAELRPETKEDLEALAFKLNPAIGYFDPLDMANLSPWGYSQEETIGWLRHSEIKHGRVAMFAFVGYCVQTVFRWPWAMTLDGTPFPSLDLSPPEQWDALPVAAKAQIILFVGFLEYYSELTPGKGADSGLPHYTKGGQPGKYPTFDSIPHYVPFNLYDPFGINKNMSEEVKERRLRAEINNGRLAMLGIFGFLCAQTIPGSVPLLDGVLKPYLGQVMAPFDANFF